ncbi:MAG: cysteine desulfurase family protein [Actinomycetales bacterium]
MPKTSGPGAMERAHWDSATHAPISPAAQEALLAALDEGWADPRRLHREGRRARLLADGAREAIAAELGARTEEVSLTGSFELACQGALLGAANGRRTARPLVVHSAIEHSALLTSVQWLQDRGGQARQVGVDAAGRVDAAAFVAAVDGSPPSGPSSLDPSSLDPSSLERPSSDRSESGGSAGARTYAHPDTRTHPGVAVLQFANAEVGTAQPVEQIQQACRARGIPLVCDVSTSVAALPTVPTDLAVADPSCWGGPSGLGVLVVRSGVRWRSPWPAAADGAAHTPLSPGGAYIPLALAAAVGLQDAMGGRRESARHRHETIAWLRERLPAAVPDLVVVGDPDRRLPHVLTFSVLYADGESLVEELDRAGFAVGSGSACTASTLQPSHVLAAMGALTHGNVRIAIPPTPRDELTDQAERFIAALSPAVDRVRERLGGAGL